MARRGRKRRLDLEDKYWRLITSGTGALEACRLVGIGRKTGYRWRHERGGLPPARAIEDEWIKERIAFHFEANQGTYGAPRLVDDLADEGIRVSRKRIARLMRELSIAGVSGREGKRRRRKSTVAESEPVADLVRRDFTADEPNQVWFADITYVPTWEGWLFLAVVMDACTTRIVGWSMRDDLKSDIVHRRPRHGDDDETARRRPRSPLRPWSAIPLARVRQVPP